MSDGRSTYDDSALPWLEAVDDDDNPAGVSARRMLGALVIILVAAAIVAGTFFWLGRQDPVGIGGAPELIRAEPTPYKTRPAEPGGLDVKGESETAYQTSAGEDTDAQLDLEAVPEQPVARPTEAPPKSLPSNEVKERVEESPSGSPLGGAGSVVQLGAYRNAAQAERAWAALSARFPAVAALNKMVVPFSGGFRLRAGASSPSEARQACQALRAAGENCFVAN